MFHVTEYEFYRSGKRRDLYKYRYFEADAPSLHLIVQNWKPWSTWLTSEQIKKVIKERQRFPDLLKGLRSMKAGTRSSKRFVQEKHDRDVYMWNTPQQAIASNLSRIIFANYPSPPLQANEAINLIISQLDNETPVVWITELNRLIPQFDLDEEQKKALEEAKANSQMTNVFIEKLKEPIQHFLDENRLQGQVLTNRNLVKKIDNDVYQVEKYIVDIRDGSCTCENYERVLKDFSLFCKHLYAATLYRESQEYE